MVITSLGGWVRAELSQDEVEAFASRWPCYGPRNPLTFDFDGRGDLVDLWGDDEDNDGAGVSALADDARLTIALTYGRP